jgi:hypothetical protein
MKTELFDELVSALSEDFTLEELSDLSLMERELKFLLGSTPHEARHLAKAAAEVKRVRGEVKPYWKYLLNVH